jgi:hypothetical protein
MVVVLALLAGLALPMTAVQILWVNLITGITLGLALAFEPTEAGTMARPPRRRDAPILSGGTGLACRAGGGAVPGGGLRHLHLCASTGAIRWRWRRPWR